MQLHQVGARGFNASQICSFLSEMCYLDIQTPQAGERPHLCDIGEIAMKLSPRYLFAIATVLLLGGCRGGDASFTAPETDANATLTRDAVLPVGGQGFLPLDVGNVWHYDRTFESIMRDNDGNVIDMQSLEENVVHEIVGVEQRFGRTYILNEQRFVREGGDLLWWNRYRQNRSGLYSADIGLGEPPASGLAAANRRQPTQSQLLMPQTLPMHSLVMAPEQLQAWGVAWQRLVEKRMAIATAQLGPPGGALSDEITLLRYPFRPGRRWQNRVTPFLVESEVEGHDVLELPAGRFSAWRVRLTNEALDENDSVLFWYGRSGLLAETIHIESVATDLGGNVLGTVVSDETMLLADLQLVGRGRR
jgi:hypothetical protein